MHSNDSTEEAMDSHLVIVAFSMARSNLGNRFNRIGGSDELSTLLTFTIILRKLCLSARWQNCL